MSRRMQYRLASGATAGVQSTPGVPRPPSVIVSAAAVTSGHPARRSILAPPPPTPTPSIHANGYSNRLVVSQTALDIHHIVHARPLATLPAPSHHHTQIHSRRPCPCHRRRRSRRNRRRRCRPSSAPAARWASYQTFHRRSQRCRRHVTTTRSRNGSARSATRRVSVSCAHCAIILPRAPRLSLTH